MNTKTVRYHGVLLTREMKLIIKQLIKERDGSLCSKCEQVEAKEIHHTEYNEFPMLEDLVMLCHDCHIDITIANRGHQRRKGLSSAEVRRLQRAGR